MKRILFAWLILSAGTTAVVANVRPPYFRDGSFGGHPAVARGPEAVVLAGEVLTVSLPIIELDGFKPNGAGSFAEVQAEYRLVNTGTAALSLPVAFLAVDLADIRIQANGVPLVATRERNAALEAEFLVRLTGHRLAWQKQRFGKFFHRLGERSDWEKKTAQDPVGIASILDWIRTVGIDAAFRQAFGFFRSDVPLPLAQTAFFLPLPPGETRLVCRYRQRLSVDEVTTRYGGITLHGGYLAFEYLLYPAEGWHRAADFRFRLEVRAPDMVDRGFFSDDWFEPRIESTHPLGAAAYDRRTRTSRYQAEFGDFHKAVLGLLISKGKER